VEAGDVDIAVTPRIGISNLSVIQPMPAALQVIRDPEATATAREAK
jgi:hypothetical protein